MTHPIPQTPEELERDCLGTIWRVCDDMIRCIQQGDEAGLDVHYDFLRKQMNRRELIRKHMKQSPV